MPVEATIPLAGKPPVLPEWDVTKTFLTLGQLKYLGAEQARAEAQTGLVQTQGAAALADLAALQRLRAVDPRGGAPAAADPTGLPLSSLSRGPLSPGADLAPGAPAAPSAAGAPPGGPPPAPARKDTATLAREYLAADPIKGLEIAKGLFDQEKAGLESAKLQLEQGATQMAIASAAYNDVHDQASLERANALIAHVTGRDVSHLPTVYSPEAMQQIAHLQRTAEQRLAQRHKALELQIQKQNADSQTVLAEAERVKVPIAAHEAETRRIEATKPLPAGPGYLQHPQATPYRQVGPQPGTTQAPRSPQGQAQYDTLSTQFEAGSKTFGEATEAFNRLITTSKETTSTGDRALLQAFVKLTDPGQVVGASFAKETQGLGNIREQAVSEYNRLLTDKEGTLDPTLRAKFVATAKRIHALQIDQHLQLRDDIRAKAKAQGLPPDEVAPHRLTTYGSGGTAISQQKLKEYLADQRRKGHTRGQAILDLADRGYYVRGGPE